VIATFRRSYKN